MKCPHCRKRISAGVMCADCADAISTHELFECSTFGGRIPDEMVLPVWFAGPVVVGFAALVSLLLVV